MPSIASNSPTPNPSPIPSTPRHIRERIAGAEAVNAAVEQRKRKAELAAEAECGRTAESKRLTDAMDARKADMLARLEAADMPVDGTRHGGRGGDAERHPARAGERRGEDSTCHAPSPCARMRGSRCFGIRDGSLLDERLQGPDRGEGGRARISGLDGMRGFESGKIGIVIEAGEVANAEVHPDMFEGEGA